MNGITGVYSLAFQEIAADGGSRSFGGHQDDVDLLGWNDSRLIGIDDAETVREVERLTGCQMRFQFRPIFLLARVGEQILDDGSPASGFVERQEGLARLPAVLLGQ